MSRLLRLSSWRHGRRHPLQLALSIAGVALGVAVVLAIEIALGSARVAFRLSTEAVTGPVTHQIVGASGVDEEVWEQIDRWLAESGAAVTAAPVVEGRIQLLDGEEATALRLVGVDPRAEERFTPGEASAAPRERWQGVARGRPVSVELEPAALLRTELTPLLLERASADQLGLAPGDPVRLRGSGGELPGIVAGTLALEDALGREALRDTAFGSIAAAQRLLGLDGRLSRIDVRLQDDADSEALQRLESVLPAGVTLLQSEARTGGTLRMADAFEVNLRALSLLALLCGLFLVYNTASFSVVQRRQQIGLLRALGVRRGEVLRGLLGEVAAIASVGTVLGIGLGLLLAHGLVHLVTRTLNDLYFRSAVRELEVPPWALAQVLLLGLVCSLVAAARPALEATRVPPRRSLLDAPPPVSRAQRVGVLGAGVVLLAVGAVILVLAERSLVASFAGLFLAILGFAALVPGATALIVSWTEPLLPRVGADTRMLVRGVRRSLGRTGVAIAALTVAISVTVGIGVMVGSFRDSVAQWLGDVLREDLYVIAYLAGERVSFDADEVEPLRELPGVASMHSVQRLDVEDEGGRTTLVVLDFDRWELEGYRFTEGSLERAWPAITERDAVIVSEPLAFHRRLGVGDRIQLPTDHGERRFEITGVYRDYSTDRGEVLFHRQTFERWFDDRLRFGVSFQAEPGVDLEALQQRIQAALPAHLDWQVRSSARLREEALAVFDRTFVITSVLRLLAGLVAFLGVVSALLALQLERRRELATLRALGYTQRRLRRLVLGQTALLGGVAGLLSLPLGLALAMAMIVFINRRSFGWSMELVLVPGVLVQAVLLALVAAILAGLYPARQMARTSPAEALRAD